jgi:hypothetical protein
MSPQLWCQMANDNFPKWEGTCQYQMANSFVMEWDQRNFRRMVPWDRRTNTGRVRHLEQSTNVRSLRYMKNNMNVARKHDYMSYKAHIFLDDHTEASGNHRQADHGQTRSLAGEGDEDDAPPCIYKR